MTSNENYKIELRDALLPHMQRISGHVRKQHWEIVDALVDVTGELKLDPSHPEDWNIKAWPYFITAMKRRLDGDMSEHAENVRSTLQDMRDEIDKMAILNLLHLKWP